MLGVGIVGLIFNVILNLTLIPHFGILGAAWTTVATEAVDLGMMSWYLWKKERL